VLRVLLLVALTTGLVMLTGCGGSDESSATETTTVTETVTTTETVTVDAEGETVEADPDDALAEIQAIGPLLDDAVEQYDSGDQGGAADSVSAIHAEHYELAQGPLAEADAELAERLDVNLSTALPMVMEEADRPDDVYDLVDEVKADLAEAESELE
jgi:hypothetical protein